MLGPGRQGIVIVPSCCVCEGFVAKYCSHIPA